MANYDWVAEAYERYLDEMWDDICKADDERAAELAAERDEETSDED